MKQNHPKSFVILAAMLILAPVLRAQIPTPAATNITQTGATLSATFPEGDTENGFHYKYGTVPAIDEFSRTALAMASDPVKLTTNTFHAVTTKGYVETKSGTSGTITATVTLYEPSALTFDWSIDAEDGCAYLRFLEGTSSASTEKKRITGDTPFTPFTIQLNAGTHYLKWEYVQSSPSSIGLDIARIKNITIENTLPGKWQTAPANGPEAQLTGLIPNSNVIYRAWSTSATSNLYSTIQKFKTEPLDIQPLSVDNPTQTSVHISRIIGPTDASLTRYIRYGALDPNIKYAVADPDNIPIFNQTGFEFTQYGLRADFSSTSISDCNIEFEISDKNPDGGKLEFYIFKSSNYTYSKCYIYIDGTQDKSVSYGGSSFSKVLKPGKHTLTIKGWKSASSTSYNFFAQISDLKIENTTGSFGLPDKYLTYQPNLDKHTLCDLKPNTYYTFQSVIRPANAKDYPQAWQGDTSQTVSIKTLPVVITAKCDTTTQATLTFTANVERGDAETKAFGYRYKIESATQWIDVAQDNNLSEFTQTITRLKPDKKYLIEPYIIYKDGEYLYGKTLEITTAPVVPLKPKTIFLSQHQAKIQGEIIFGDATIYQRGMQFRKKGVSTWTDVEDNGEDATYILERKDLEQGQTYEVRTYVQPVGSDIVYSDILSFTTLNHYIVRNQDAYGTPTTIKLTAKIGDIDDDITIEKAGFEYYIARDGFNSIEFHESNIIDLPAEIKDSYFIKTIPNLRPRTIIKYTGYVVVNGTKFYSPATLCNAGYTEKTYLKAATKNLTPTSISLSLSEVGANMNAQITDLEYAVVKYQDDVISNEPKTFISCSTNLEITDLDPSSKYHIFFRGKVNGGYCYIDIKNGTDETVSCVSFTTPQVFLDVKYTNITQTSAKMSVGSNLVNVDADIVYYKQWEESNQPYSYSGPITVTGLKPDTRYSFYFILTHKEKQLFAGNCNWPAGGDPEGFDFTTKKVSTVVYPSPEQRQQTSLKIGWSNTVGDATFVETGIEIDGRTFTSEMGNPHQLVTELTPGTTYPCRSFVVTKEGGKVYSNWVDYSTSEIYCETLPVSNISNRSATLNGTIDCDDNSSAEFGFQWKQMSGWQSDPAFTKGRKLDDGTITLSLVNGMLEPNTDYQFRTAVRYKGVIYSANNWENFRTESEYVYQPTTVQTLIRTDRENNCLVLCGYFIAGSETITSHGYEYWRNSGLNDRAKAPQTPTVISTDESMHHQFAVGELPEGNYSVRAYVKTEGGETIYGSTIGFASSAQGYQGVDVMSADEPEIVTAPGKVKIMGAQGLTCRIYTLTGLTVVNRTLTDHYEEINLTPQSFYIVTLSNGLVRKVKL